MPDFDSTLEVDSEHQRCINKYQNFAPKLIFKAIKKGELKDISRRFVLGNSRGFHVGSIFGVISYCPNCINTRKTEERVDSLQHCTQFCRDPCLCLKT